MKSKTKKLTAEKAEEIIDNVKRELKNQGDTKASAVLEMIEDVQVNYGSEEPPADLLEACAAEVVDMGGWGAEAARQLRQEEKPAPASAKATTHTPGPWHVEPKVSDHGASLVICSEALEADILAVIPPLNDADEPDFETAERGPHDEANARLMAAAPEMEEALRKWEQFWDEMPKGQLGKIVCDIGLLNEAFLLTAKALKKSKGEKLP